MLEILAIVLVIYLGLKVAWWLVKATVVVGLAALLIAAVFTPWVFVF